MVNGEHTFYTLQHKLTHESPWLQPDGPLKPVKSSGWAFTSWDYFGYFIEPWHGRGGNDWKPKYRKSHDETHDVWSKTGYHGWWTLKYAVKGLQRMKEASSKGDLCRKDGYGKICQACRYDFRIVKITLSHNVEPVSLDDVLSIV